VRLEANDRRRLEQLCRCITRRALSDEQVQFNAAGQVELKLKTPWRDGTTHLVMPPLEFMQRLAALVLALRQPGPGCWRDTSCERLLRGDQLRPLRVAEGSVFPFERPLTGR